jgi:hypothetical protein
MYGCRTSLPPIGTDSTIMVTRTGSSHEAVLKWLKCQLSAARESLAAFAEAAGIVRRVRSSSSPASLPAEMAQLILSWASSLTLDCPVRKFEPERLESPTFLAVLGMRAGGVRSTPWTGELLQRALVYYADAIGRAIEGFLEDLQDTLDEQVAAFAREVDRLKGETAALTHRLETWQDRAKAAALIPQEAIMDRVAKYEKHLNAQFTSSLHELERLQARRIGKAVVPPLVADVQVIVNQELG